MLPGDGKLGALVLMVDSGGNTDWAGRELIRVAAVLGRSCHNINIASHPDISTPKQR